VDAPQNPLPRSSSASFITFALSLWKRLVTSAVHCTVEEIESAPKHQHQNTFASSWFNCETFEAPEQAASLQNKSSLVQTIQIQKHLLHNNKTNSLYEHLLNNIQNNRPRRRLYCLAIMSLATPFVKPYNKDESGHYTYPRKGCSPNA
jgi:hypothetical protein